MRGREEPIFDTDQIDCRAVVNKLAAAIREEEPTYFYTHTCSMKTHFGMKLLWEWLNSEAKMAQVCDGTESENKRSHLRNCITNSSGVYMLRAWMEMVHIWILYITESPEHPIGNVTKHWFRMELQDAKANLPHVHSLLWTTDNLDTEAGRVVAQNRIRASIADIVRPGERESYIAEGIFQNEHDIFTFQDLMSRILHHKHNRRCYVVSRKRHRRKRTEDALQSI